MYGRWSWNDRMRGRRREEGSAVLLAQAEEAGQSSAATGPSVHPGGVL